MNDEINFILSHRKHVEVGAEVTLLSYLLLIVRNIMSGGMLAEFGLIQQRLTVLNPYTK